MNDKIAFMNRQPYPCIWLKQQDADVATFYTHVFPNSRVVEENEFLYMLQIGEQQLMLLNGNAEKEINPSISLFLHLTSAEEIEDIWKKLLPGGKALMDLDKYPWCEKYGWVQDKYGVSWQLYLIKEGETDQPLCPSLMFTKEQVGKAEEAMKTYTSIFPMSEIENILRYPEGQDDAGLVQHAQFRIKNYLMMCMESSLSHDYSFNEAVSMVVPCADQQEIDFYWAKLSEGGREGICGWLTDKYGISWQIAPYNIGSYIDGSEKSKRAMDALRGMTKVIISDLDNA